MLEGNVGHLVGAELPEDGAPGSDLIPGIAQHSHIRRERRNKQQAWTELWYSGAARGLAVGSVILAVGAVVLITVLVPTGLVGGAICLHGVGCAWSDTQGVRIAPTDQPVTVSTR